MLSLEVVDDVADIVLALLLSKLMVLSMLLMLLMMLKFCVLLKYFSVLSTILTPFSLRGTPLTKSVFHYAPKMRNLKFLYCTLCFFFITVADQ